MDLISQALKGGKDFSIGFKPFLPVFLRGLKLLVIVSVTIFFVIGCGIGEPTPGEQLSAKPTVPTNTPQPPTTTPTSTATPTDTPQPPTDTPTSTPTNTPEPPTSTPTPTPTDTPEPPTDTPTSTSTSTPEPPTSTPTPEIPPTPPPPNIIASDGAMMILIPAGPFEMGSTSGIPDEQPRHTVTLDAFYIDQHEVTNAQYTLCVDGGGCSPPTSPGSYTREDYYFGNPGYANYPVIFVNWGQAKTYCEWREARLPTEAEWEKAARGTDTRSYPWGDAWEQTRLNSAESGLRDTTPVGQYSPGGDSPYGVADLAGNVSEWAADWYSADYYATSPATNPTGPPSGSERVGRGGSWSEYRFSVRIALRFKFPPTFSFHSVGFRCARSP